MGERFIVKTRPWLTRPAGWGPWSTLLRAKDYDTATDEVAQFNKNPPEGLHAAVFYKGKAYGRERNLAGADLRELEGAEALLYWNRRRQLDKGK